VQTTLPTSQQVDRALQEVYSRPEFATRPEHSPWEILLKPLGRFFRWLEGLLDGFKGLEVNAPWLYWLVIAWLAISAIAILAHLILTATSAIRWREKAIQKEAPEEGGRRGPRTPADWEAEARRAAAEGRMRDAAIALYQAVLLRLDARGALRFDPSKTPGDYRREVRRHPDVAPPFSAFLRGFEPVVFGGRPLDATSYDQLRARAAEVVHG
jgi:hypothetical protein